MGVLLIFVDGLGVGTRGGHNPLHLLGEEAAPLAVFAGEEPTVPYGGACVCTDPRLGVEGRPQSASGQTTILTGVNAPALLGRHKQGFPNEALRAVLREHSIFRRLAAAGAGPNLFANAYGQSFFEQRPRWVSATTIAVEAASLPFRTAADLRAGRAVFHDFTNRLLAARGESVPLRSPEQAASILARLAAEHAFTLYEHYLTDRAGHEQDGEAARRVLKELARFVRAALEETDLGRTTVLLVSDHGNVEDLSVRNHTLNDVPTLVWGPARVTVTARVRTLADIAPTIFDILTTRGSHT
jgi:2,3-bisphosphoglycerate-independent phosphoglycerate mutase